MPSTPKRASAFASFLAKATDLAVPPCKRVRAARAVLEALHPKPPKPPRRPVARSPDELRAALEALHARRDRLKRP